MILPTLEEISQQLIAGNTAALSRAITFAESKKVDHQTFAQALIKQILPKTGKAKRIAITGVPGAGKSTFIESFGLFLIKKGLKVAVLAIDPSSSLSGGSILGDKTRMEELAKSANAFIRPSATRGSLGGITARSYEAILLCEAAGYDVILVETVGVGQSETLVHEITDFFLFLQVSGTGDDLQGIKRGIMEMADLIFLNKSDLYDAKILQDSKMDLHRSLQFLPNKDSTWKRKILKGSGYQNAGIAEVWEQIEAYFELVHNNGYLEKNRLNQKMQRLDNYIEEIMLNEIKSKIQLQKEIQTQKELLKNQKITPFDLANELINKYFNLK